MELMLAVRGSVGGEGLDPGIAVLLLTIVLAICNQEHSGEGHEDEERCAETVKLPGISGEEA